MCQITNITPLELLMLPTAYREILAAAERTQKRRRGRASSSVFLNVDGSKDPHKMEARLSAQIDREKALEKIREQYKAARLELCLVLVKAPLSAEDLSILAGRYLNNKTSEKLAKEIDLDAAHIRHRTAPAVERFLEIADVEPVHRRDPEDYDQRALDGAEILADRWIRTHSPA